MPWHAEPAGKLRELESQVEAIVISAQRNQVVEVSHPTTSPRLDMVDLLYPVLDVRLRRPAQDSVKGARA